MGHPPHCGLCCIQLCLHCCSGADTRCCPTILLGGSLGGSPSPTPPYCCYLGLNKDFLRMPVLPVILGLWGGARVVLGPVTCFPPVASALPLLEPMPWEGAGMGAADKGLTCPPV